MRQRGAVGVLADDDEALLGPQDHQRLEPDDDGVEGLAGLAQMRPQRLGAIRADRDLVTPVAGEADTGDANLVAVVAAMADCHVRQVGIVERQAEVQCFEQRPGVWPETVSVAMSAVALWMYTALRPKRSWRHSSSPRMHGSDMRGRARHDEAMLVQPHQHAVVERPRRSPTT